MKATAKLTDDWVPLPSEILRTLGWTEGQRLHLEVIGGTLVVEADPSPDPKPSKRPQP